MDLMTEWAQQWGVHPVAIVDLLRRMDKQILPEFKRNSRDVEATVNNRMRLEAADLGIWMMRNNSGAYEDEYGNWVRYGLCNDSEKVNRVAKSCDLVGIRPRLITPADVGSTIGQMCLREGKKSDWVFSGDEHETAQLNFMRRAIAHGADARFSTGPGSFA